ncbi:hypothetical protein CASFOL_031444 [Castilleja foliolosa]|uniref:Uncharacterized protein n=1 Tax=Castilleja foliolosa TaxID=1961234 RepID=A0ABD3C6M6_9LAMI
MNQVPGNSWKSTAITEQQYDDSALEGVAANIKLLLKLTQDHKDACDKEKNGSRRMLRVATMMTILDNIRDRIQKCQSFGNRVGSGAEMRRCNTIPKPRNPPVPRVESDGLDEENERLRRELSGSLAAQKSLQAMCTSLGKEKEIMAAELSRRVHELGATEELINDLKVQNEMLLEKVKKCASEKKHDGGGVNSALRERNDVLSEQLLKMLDGYRTMKRKLRKAEEENGGMRSFIDEMRAKIVGSLERIRGFKEGEVLSPMNVDVREEIVALESMFECFETMVVDKDGKKQGDCVQHKGEISACKPSILA